MFGRDGQIEELARLVTDRSFRSGLLFGEPGVGKTSLLRAGLVPYLRDHGVIALLCGNLHRPTESFANALAATGLGQTSDEPSVAFLARVVADSLDGQQYLFILDQVDEVLNDEASIAEIGELFARVVTRSSGRARFLFCCDNEHLHLFGRLEQRTGSLFPPSSRYQLRRFSADETRFVLSRTLALATVPDHEAIAQRVADTLATDGDVLPADVQIAALSVKELQSTPGSAMSQVGGAAELERVWLTSAAAATSNTKAALRLMAEFAGRNVASGLPATIAAARASIEPAFAETALPTLREKGVLSAITIPGAQETHYELAHRILGPRVREVAAPAREAARHAFELLGSKVVDKKRLSAREWLALRREGISPSTPDEAAVVQRTKRFFLIVLGVAVAIPLLALTAIYISMSGHYYMDVSREDSGGAERVVLRAGRPSLTAFHWLPHSPGFGSIVADTGYTEQMLSPESWKRAATHAVSGDLDSDFAATSDQLLRPELYSLIDYATTGSDSALGRNRESSDNEQFVALLRALRPVAHGSPKEVALVEEAVASTSLRVQAAGLEVAASAAARVPQTYRALLAKAATSADADLRRAALGVIRALPHAIATALIQEALTLTSDAELTTSLSAALATSAAPTAAGSTTNDASAYTKHLRKRDLSATAQRAAIRQLERSFFRDTEMATLASIELAQDAKAPARARVRALQLIAEHTSEEQLAKVAKALKELRDTKPDNVRAALLPLLARVDPADTKLTLASLLDQQAVDPGLRAASAHAWGEIARTKDKAARSALEILLKDRDTQVRAAAARAYGHLGRPAQTQLTKMVKNERREVAEGAAFGLANTAMAGASSSVAVDGIAQLWRRKGRSRRMVARALAYLANRRPRAASVYISAAARNTDDAGLRPIGVTGLCSSARRGYKPALGGLVRAAGDPSTTVRTVAIECVVDNPKATQSIASRAASKLLDDRDPTLRKEAAAALLGLATAGKISKQTAQALERLLGDANRNVRLIALQGITKMGTKAPDSMPGALAKAFRVADERERLALLQTAQDIGDGELAAIALRNESAVVRIAGIDAAIATKTGMRAALQAGLTDKVRSVRLASLHRLTQYKDSLDQEAIDRALVLGIADDDPAIRDLALTSMAKLAAKGKVLAQLRLALLSRSEKERSRAARAASGLVERYAQDAELLLVPLLSDPSHDVRVAALPSLAAAYTKTNAPKQLEKMLRDSERDAMLRLVATAAFVVLSQTEAGRPAALEALSRLADKATPLVRSAAALGKGLIEHNADGVAFLQLLVP